MDYRLLLVRVFVRDLERAVDFYTRVLGMPLSFRSDEMGWAQLGTAGAELALERAAADDPETKDLVGRFVGLSLAVPDIAAAHRTLVARGVEFLHPPERMPWGGVLAHLRDPDGNVLTLVGSPT
jgi:catechol 2,3-dioxygenase-like lactoylglutathione lyase family enzyme